MQRSFNPLCEVLTCEPQVKQAPRSDSGVGDGDALILTYADRNVSVPGSTSFNPLDGDALILTWGFHPFMDYFRSFNPLDGDILILSMMVAHSGLCSKKCFNALTRAFFDSLLSSNSRGW